MKRFIPYIIGGFVIILLIIVTVTRKQGNTSSLIQTQRVNKTTFTKTVQSSGKTKAKKSAELRFQTSGRLAWVNVKEGDTVSVGQAIAGLDSREVQKTLEKTLIDYSAERSVFEESWRTNWKAAAESHESFINAPTEAIRNILENNQWDLTKAVLDVELKHLAVEYATIYSPISGVVTHIETSIPGVNITPATSTFEIVDPDSLVFEANIDEIDVGSLEVGQQSTINLDAFPNASISGTVSYISFSSVISGGGATVFPVQISLDSPKQLRIGLNGDVTVITHTLPNVLTIPLEAIREDDNNMKYVYKKNGKGFTKTFVTTGEQNENEIVIQKGLSSDDVIVVKGFASISK